MLSRFLGNLKGLLLFDAVILSGAKDLTRGEGRTRAKLYVLIFECEVPRFARNDTLGVIAEILPVRIVSHGQTRRSSSKASRAAAR